MKIFKLILFLSSILIIKSIEICCEYFNNNNNLVDCILSSYSNYILYNQTINQNNINNNKENKSVFIVFASTNIYNYVSYSLLVNLNYIINKNYLLKFENEEIIDYFPSDRRWNKIGSVIEAIKPKIGWAKDYNYIVAMDADLIIMDPNFDIELIASQYPEAHLILSSDFSDIGNTGFMIIKNSKWSYNFFEMWFETRFSYDCDQHAFNDLYNRIQSTKKSKSRIEILPPGEINTEFPAGSTFNDKSAVLHLMGESDSIRYNVFKYAAESVCWKYLIENDPYYLIDKDDIDIDNDNDDHDNNNHNNEQLNEINEEINRRSIRYGLTRKVFTSILYEELLIPINEKYSECYNLLYDLPPNSVLLRKYSQDEIQEIVFVINDCFSELHSATSTLCSPDKYIVENITECTELYNKNYLLAEKGVRILPQGSIQLYDHMTRNLYDSFLVLGNSDKAIEIAEKVLILLQKLTSLIPVSNIDVHRLLLYRRSSALSQLSVVARELKLLDKSLKYANDSLQLAVQINIPPIPLTHTDYETYIRSIILAYMAVGDIYGELELNDKCKEMYQLGLKETIKLFLQSNKEKNQINAFLNDQFLKLFHLEIQEIKMKEKKDGDNIVSIDGSIDKVEKVSKYEGLLKLIKEFDEVHGKYGMQLGGELERIVIYSKKIAL